jgi:glycosyltransferase involved in cell wall biosynthesis
MKILHCDEMFHPHFGYQINVLAKFQANLGHEIIILTSDKIEEHPTFSDFATKTNIDEADELYSKQYGVKIIRFPIFGVFSGRVIYRFGFIEKIIELNPDLIFCHTNDTLSAIQIILNAKRIGKPIVFDNHMLSMASMNPLSSFFKLFYRTFITPIIVKNKWIVIRTQDDDYVNKYYKIPKELSPFISFGTDTLIFYKDETNRKKFRKENEISEYAFVVLYAGKINKQKGARLLANALTQRFNTEKEVVFLVIGSISREDKEEIERLFKESENRIVRFPTQKYTDLPKFYQTADICMFPKQCSLSFYDAQACGLPVIVEENNINLSRIQNNNGVSFKSGDMLDFRLKIEEMINKDEAEINQMRSNSIDYIEKNFSYDVIVKRYLEIIENEFERFQN